MFDHNVSTKAIYHDTVLAMLDLLVAGFNCSLLCFGESGSGKTYTLTGEESTGVDGVIQLMIKDLFDKTSTGYGESLKYYISFGLHWTHDYKTAV